MIAWNRIDEFSENFQTASDPTLFSENYVALFCNKLFGVERPPPLFPKIHQFYPLKITQKPQRQFFGSETIPPPSPLRMFSENSSIQFHVALGSAGRRPARA